MTDLAHFDDNGAIPPDPDERPSWLQPIGVRLAIILGLSAAFWAVVLGVVF